jgi:phosphoribosylglycinamide formyltransferase-1
LNDARTTQPVVILISGRGTNMLALLRHSREPACPYRIARVISDQPAALGLAAATELGVDTAAVPFHDCADRVAYDRRLAEVVDESGPALIVLAGFMRILSAEFVARYAGRILNIHPSLLPKYPGLHTHRRALEAGDRTHGASVHFVTAELDGGPPILQVRVPVEPADDETTLAARVQAGEHQIYPMAVEWYCTGRLACRDGRVWLDGVALTAPVTVGLSAASYPAPQAH